MNPGALSDSELARRIQQGAAQDLEQELVQRFRRRVVLFAQRHTRDAALSEDIAQDVMTKVLEKLRAGEVEEPERIGSFILGTARWTVHSARRRERRAVEVHEAARAESVQHIEQAPALESQRLAAALAELSERDRAVIVMSFLEDRSAQEIADAFTLTPGNVRVIRHRAIMQLGRTLQIRELNDEVGS
ncbi:MAG: RNA polymerase sigma factor [Polyangiaceae bacterium]